MATYNETGGASLLAGASDPDGDPIRVRRINGEIVTQWPASVALPKGALLIAEDGTATYDDGGSPSGHPAPNVRAPNGSITFTLWDGIAESATCTATVELLGVMVNAGPVGADVELFFDVPSR